MELKEVSLETLASGALPELFEHEMERVLEDIQDPNKEATAVRQITMVVSFKPDEDRDRAATALLVKTKLATPKPVATTIHMGRNAERPAGRRRLRPAPGGAVQRRRPRGEPDRARPGGGRQ